MAHKDPDYTVNLEACDDANTLYYKVSVTDANDVSMAGFSHKTENYNEALVYAKVFFDELSKSNIVVASYIEQPGRLAKQGALYSIGTFAAGPSDIVSDTDFYNTLSEEFFEHCRRQEVSDVNVVFRKIVQKHKLDLYKESRFLGHLQRMGILEKVEGDDEFWIEEN